jgi:heptosyltransferase-3
MRSCAGHKAAPPRRRPARGAGAFRAEGARRRVDALVYDDTAPMLEGHPSLSLLHGVGRNWKADGALSRLSKERRLFSDLRRRRYGLIVHLTEHPRGAWLARALGARYAVAPRVPDRGAFWAGSFTHLYPLAARRHMLEVNLDALRRIGVQPEPAERKVEFVPGPDAEKKVQTW